VLQQVAAKTWAEKTNGHKANKNTFITTPTQPAPHPK
jgi:hypothetical protein